MVKKIKTSQLKPGMYIHDLNCSWLEHPFFGRSLAIKSAVMVEKIVRFGIREVYIDTAKGIDVDEAPSGEEAGEAKTKHAAETNASAEQTAHEGSDEIGFKTVERAYLCTEIRKARKIRKHAMETVRKVMKDIKAGNGVKKEAVEDTVDDIIVSVLRNQDALTSLSMLRSADEYLFNHSISVCVLMVAFGKSLGFDPSLLKEVGVGALLHDIGTMKVSPEILTKKSTLTDDEFEQIKSHVVNTRDILLSTEGIGEESIAMAYQHHERLDGSGYPNGLKGDEISYIAQALAIVDVYDALTTKRCYRRKIAPTKALELIYERGGTEFNRELVQKFIKCIGIYPVGSLVRLASGLLCIVINHNEDELLHPIVRAIYNTKTDRCITIPYDIDLSEEPESEEQDRIVSYEVQDDWQVTAERYL